MRVKSCVKDEMERVGLNIRSLTARTTSAESTVGNVVRGTYQPSLPLALEISYALGKSVNDLFQL